MWYQLPCCWQVYILPSYLSRSILLGDLPGLMQLVHIRQTQFSISFHILTLTSNVFHNFTKMCSSWPANTYMSMNDFPKKEITKYFILASPTMSCIMYSFSDNWGGGRNTVIQLLLCRMSACNKSPLSFSAPCIKTLSSIFFFRTSMLCISF